MLLIACILICTIALLSCKKQRNRHSSNDFTHVDFENLRIGKKPSDSGPVISVYDTSINCVIGIDTSFFERGETNEGIICGTLENVPLTFSKRQAHEADILSDSDLKLDAFRIYDYTDSPEIYIDTFGVVYYHGKAVISTETYCDSTKWYGEPAYTVDTLGNVIIGKDTLKVNNK